MLRAASAGAAARRRATPRPRTLSATSPTASGIGPGPGGPARGGTRTGRAGAGAFGGGAGGAGGIQGSATTTLTSSEKAIYDYVSAHRDGASYLFAVSSWETASPYIEATGQEVMPMGGFSGSVPEPTLAHVEQLVKSGQLKFFLLDGTGTGGGFGGRGGTGSTVSAIESWVENTCSTVPASDYSGASTTTGAGGTLYACSASS